MKRFEKYTLYGMIVLTTGIAGTLAYQKYLTEGISNRSEEIREADERVFSSALEKLDSHLGEFNFKSKYLQNR